MSYFLFGTIDASKDDALMRHVKTYAKEKDIYVWFDDEITFYEEIHRMLTEQKSKGHISFAITSKNQPYNSSDVLFPFDRFSNEDLFADKTREFYRKCCKNNIEILFDCLKKIIVLFGVQYGEIFVVEGYDDTFKRKECDFNSFKRDLLLQIEENVFIDSCIYCVKADEKHNNG